MEHRPRRPATPGDFGIAIICAFEFEADAVIALFDHHWGVSYDKAASDFNIHTTGSIGRHNVVVAYTPGMWKADAALVAANCRASFPNISLAILVGVCGVVPISHDGDEMVLGDVVISDSVVQYDLRAPPPARFVGKKTVLESVGSPNGEIRSLLAKLRDLRGHRLLQDEIAGYMDTLRGKPELAAEYPGVKQDKLFEAAYRHLDNSLPCEECGCNGPLVLRSRLEQGSPQPAVHFGPIASCDTMMKSGEDRDMIARQMGVVAFDMEGSSVWESFPRVVIKGACDYADSHRTEVWQGYAAATAAACMKAFLRQLSPSGPDPRPVEPPETPRKPIFPIKINGNTLDDSIEPARDASSSNYILVQTAQRNIEKDEQQDYIQYLDILDYVSTNTYLCFYLGVDLDWIRQKASVAYVDIYRESLKLEPELKEGSPESYYAVDVVFHHGQDGKTIYNSLSPTLRSYLEDVQHFKHKLRLTIQGHHLKDIAAIDAVRSVEEVGETELRIRQAWSVMRPDHTLSAAGKQEHQYEGKGQVIAVADTGFDMGCTIPCHEAFGNRVVALTPLGRTTLDCDGHGTHVCAAAVGDGFHGPVPGASQPTPIRGIAPQAKLVVQCLGCNLRGKPGDLSQLFEGPYNGEHRVRVHSNSWGKSTKKRQHRYDERATEIDRFVWEHKDMVICFAAGNDGELVNPAAQIGSEAAAKNCITVGACENDRPNQKQAPSRIPAFSSRGPTTDGRKKPDIVAPGTWILSACSGQIDPLWVISRERRDRNGRLIEKMGRPYDSAANRNWWYMHGTSMATPLVAGGVAVLREALDGEGCSGPSAALIKALLINGADLLSNTREEESGFGRVNLANSIGIIKRERGGFYEGTLKTVGGDMDPPLSNINTPAGVGLKVTLVWSDPPGSMIYNELDLTVTDNAPGGMANVTVFKATTFPPNNVQQALIPKSSTGSISADIAVNLVVSRLPDILPQPFAVVWRCF